MKDWWLYEWMYEGVEVLKARRNYVEQQDEAGGDSLVPVWKVHCRCQLLDQKPSKHPLIQSGTMATSDAAQFPMSLLVR